MGIDKGILAAIADHREKIRGPHFIFSAERPKFPQNDEMKMSHDQILMTLYSAGYDAHEIKSHYGTPSKSIIIYQIDQKEADDLHKLAARIGQEHSIYSTGLASEMRFHQGAAANRAHYANDTDYYDDPPEDGYHSLPGNAAHFNHKFDYKNAHPAGQLNTRGGNVK